MENLKFNPVGWFEIYVQDIEKARKFYSEVLQLDMQDMPDPTGDGGENMKMCSFPMTMDSITGASGALVQMTGMPSGGNSTVVYFITEDCKIEEERVGNAGGKVHQPKMSIGEFGFVSLCFDVDGNMFGLHSMQ